MNFSKDTEEILKFLDYTTEGNLRKKEDFSMISELAATYDKAEII